MTRSKDWSRSERKLTVGATAKLTADIKAREVIVYGSVKGNVRGKAKIEIKKDGSVNADLTTAQIVIKDGAYFKGSIEIEKSAEKEGDTNVFSRKASTLTALNNGNGAEDRLGSRRCFMTLTGKHALTMPFNSGSDVEARLRDPANLTSREVRDLMPGASNQHHW